jgi:hypothetical protein
MGDPAAPVQSAAAHGRWTDDRRGACASIRRHPVYKYA